MAHAAAALDKGELLSVIEYQRAVHAEARAIDDATVRGVSPAGGTLFVTTYPCHLCYKHALSVRLDHIEYIEPYPKSRAVAMFSKGPRTSWSRSPAWRRAATCRFSATAQRLSQMPLGNSPRMTGGPRSHLSVRCEKMRTKPIGSVERLTL